MKVFVSGVAGFIGSYVARALIWHGVDVVGCDNFNPYYPRKCKEFNLDLINLAADRVLQYVPQGEVVPVFNLVRSYSLERKPRRVGSFTFIEGDITNFDLLRYVFEKEKFDAVVHLAAIAGIPESMKNARLYTSVNVDGTVDLLEASQLSGVKRFIFASSSSVYGNRWQKRVSEKDGITQVISPYGATKMAGEVLCYTYSQVTGMSVVVCRIFGPVYGPLQRPYGMFVQRAINYAYNDKVMKIYGVRGLTTRKDATYINDLVRGILQCVDLKAEYEIVNLGTSRPSSISEWIRAIEKISGRKVKVEVGPPGKGEAQSSADISKAKRLLGYKPRMNLLEGIRRQVEVYTKMPAWYREMDSV